MADKKISQLSAASTPVAGTEVLPIVQSSATVKVSIDNLTKGRVVNALTFDTDVAAAGVTLTGTTLSADGSDTNIDINITPKGTGEVNLTKVDIDAGAIDGTAIGANSASTGAFTTLSASSTVSGTGFSTYLASPPAIGGTAQAAGSFTDLKSTSNITFSRIGLTVGVPDYGVTVAAGGYADTTTKARLTLSGGVGDNNVRSGWTTYSIKTNGANNGAEYYIRPAIYTGSAFTEQGSAGVYLADNATSWSSASDENLKENLVEIANASAKVSTLRAVTGKYKSDAAGVSRAFLIAQDVQKVLPEAVNEGAEGYLGLSYSDTIPLLVAAIKEQGALIQELKSKVAALEAK